MSQEAASGPGASDVGPQWAVPAPQLWQALAVGALSGTTRALFEGASLRQLWRTPNQPASCESNA